MKQEIKRIFTIGHSNHSVNAFLSILKMHEIDVVGDVRSIPYSRYNAHFNREQLKERLKIEGIKYVFLGRELGARSDDPACYKNGRVQYDWLAQTDLFKVGVERLLNGASKYTVTIMCAEKDPLECHRAVLVARKINELGVPVSHIRADGSIESHKEMEIRLLALLGLPEGNMFKSKKEFISQAYSIQGERIAYTETMMVAKDRVEHP